MVVMLSYLSWGKEEKKAFVKLMGTRSFCWMSEVMKKMVFYI